MGPVLCPSFVSTPRKGAITFSETVSVNKLLWLCLGGGAAAVLLGQTFRVYGKHFSLSVVTSRVSFFPSSPWAFLSAGLPLQSAAAFSAPGAGAFVGLPVTTLILSLVLLPEPLHGERCPCARQTRLVCFQILRSCFIRSPGERSGQSSAPQAPIPRAPAPGEALFWANRTGAPCPRGFAANRKETSRQTAVVGAQTFTASARGPGGQVCEGHTAILYVCELPQEPLEGWCLFPRGTPVAPFR